MQLSFTSHRVANRYFRRYFPGARRLYRAALDRSCSGHGMDVIDTGTGQQFYAIYDPKPGWIDYAVRLYPKT